MRLVLRSSICFTLWHGMVLSAATSVIQLANRADIIAIASVQSVAADESGTVRVELRTATTIKGESVPSTFAATLPPSPIMPHSASQSVDGISVGAVGLWFLNSTAGPLFQVLPTSSGTYTGRDAYIPTTVAGTEDAATPATVGAALFSAVIRGYTSLSKPTPNDADRLLVNFDGSDEQDAMAAAEQLMSSVSLDQNVLGLAAAIRLGSDGALLTLASRLSELQPQPNFWFIADSLRLYYRPHGASSIPVLLTLASMHSTASGIDAAVGSALFRIGTKGILPAMAQLLDSADPQAQLWAARFFAYFTTFADAGGAIGSTRGPWSTDSTRAFAPRSGTSQTPSEYANFWKTWWAENRASLGFGANP